MEKQEYETKFVLDFLFEAFPQLREESEELQQSAVEQFSVFLDAMEKFVERNHKYKDLWKKNGWLAHLIYVRMKVQRAVHMFMDTDSYKDHDDPLDDTHDAMNFQAFFVRKFKEGDRSGGMSL